MNVHHPRSGLDLTQGPFAIGDHVGGPALTPTQIKVLKGVHGGLLNKQIAFELGIAESTVKAHMTALMRKLNVRNRTQVAMAAQLWNQSYVAG